MRLHRATTSVAVVLGLVVGVAGLGSQSAPLHLNPVIAKLARGETVYGLINRATCRWPTRGRRRGRRWTSSMPTWSTTRWTLRG